MSKESTQMNRSRTPLVSCLAVVSLVLLGGCQWSGVQSLFVKKDKLVSANGCTDHSKSGSDALNQSTWVVALGEHAKQADRRPASFSRPQVASVIPDLRSPVRLVSAEEDSSEIVSLNDDSVKFVAVDGRRVRSLADCFRQLDRSAKSNELVQVDYQIQSTSNQLGKEQAARLERAQLLKLLMSCDASIQPICVENGGRSLYYLDDGNVYATVQADVQESIGIVRLSMQITNLSDHPIHVPVECTSSFGNQSLVCLTADDAFVRAYKEQSGKLKGRPLLATPQSSDSYSFAEVSQRNDYAKLPNLGRMLQQGSTVARPFFIDNSLQYPGPALRGDAIALSGSLLQPQRLEPGEKMAGWILFSLPESFDDSIAGSKISTQIVLLEVAHKLTFSW